MNLKQIIVRSRVLSLFILAACFVTATFAQQSTGSLRGKLTDELGGSIVGVQVTVTDASGATKTAMTNNDGVYTFGGLMPGTYTVRVAAQGFTPFENAAVNVTANGRDTLDIVLKVALEQQQVTVSADSTALSVDPANNAGAVILKGADLEALPDDPDDLQAALQALAGPSAGPNGGQIYIDGFTGGRFPPKESIREIRINANPFAAEFDRLGFGRIEILTKPGSDKFRGSANFNFNDESLNSRNPFVANRPPFQRRQFGGNLSGPIIKKKSSFFFDFERRETDDDAIVVAQILDPSLNQVAFNQAFPTPQRRTTISPRVDYQLNDKNTIVGRYSYAQTSRVGSDGSVGGFSLISRETNETNKEHTVQLTETAILNAKTVNETRFQYIRRRTDEIGNNSTPTISVQGAFVGGGAPFGLAFRNEDRYELQNYTSLSLGNHAVKFGGRLRHSNLTDFTNSNFNGTFVFAGVPPVLAADRATVLVPGLTSIQQYQQFLRGAAGITPSQFTIAGGNPQVGVTQTDFGGFVQDDWRYRPNLTLSAGLRYETQTNIHDKTDFAPRISFAYSPGGGANSQPKTVLRGGGGLFYDRFSENLVLTADRFNGVNQQQFIVQNPTFFTNNIPTISQLQASQSPQTIRRIAPDLRTPYTMQAAFSVERQLPYSTTLSVSYIGTRTLHLLRSRNINAPLPGTVVLNARGQVISAQYPFGAAAGNIYEFDSSGRLNQNQLIIFVRNNFNKYLSFSANYTFGKANSDTDGAGSFPANPYDFTGEYGRSSFDVRHRFFFFGNISLPHGFRLSPLVFASTGRPINIIIGRDLNGDTLFTDRPAFATDLTRPSVRVTPFGAFDLSPLPGETIIPRNFAEGPGSFSFNLRLSKTIGFGPSKESAANGNQQGGAGGRGGRGGRGGGGSPVGFPGGGGRGGMFGDTGTDKRYNLTFSIFARNLFNRVNLATPSGNLSSPFFGQSTAIAGGFGENPAGGNRQIELQLRFSF